VFMVRADRFCITCGKRCSGKQCRECFESGKYNSLSRQSQKRRSKLVRKYSMMEVG